MNTVSSYRCGCRSGYKFITKINWDLYINEPYCVDIDECRNRGVCPKKSICENTDGSYVCQCDPGFEGDLCKDIDECTQYRTCDENATCLNTDGSYVCFCNSGYRGDGITCKIGQCDDLRCPPDQKCVSPTSEKCECNDGFSMNTELEFCEDVDECGLGHDCDQNSTCVNIAGGFTCTCNPGYIADGRTCVEGTCTDDICPINAECVSPVESDCRCKNGYGAKLWKSNSTEICVDTDECSSLRVICPENALCVNFPGGYECNCQEGYFGDGKICFPGSCTDINCPSSDHKKCLSPRSNVCECTEGYKFSNSSVCIDVDECLNEPCDQNADCANEHGNFSCTCSFGYSGDGMSCSVANQTVLVLNTRSSDPRAFKIPPRLVNAQDRNEPITTISFAEETEVLSSCSVTYRNRFYVFGGLIKKRQICELTECEFKRIGSLDFDFDDGACTNVKDLKVYLCFEDDNNRQCRSAVEPLDSFNIVAPSTYDHQRIRIAASPSKL